MMPVSAVCALVSALIGCVCDLRIRRIPNVLTAVTALAGLAFHTVFSAGSGAGFSLLGAGDVKLMAALGAWLGPADAMWTAIYAALAGTVMALVVGFARGHLRAAFANVWSLLVFWRFVGIRPYEGLTLQSSKSPRLPYALPITAGLFAALWFR
jgi:prepilin peptidase CpaA